MGRAEKAIKQYKELKRIFKIAVKPLIDYLIDPNFKLKAKYSRYLQKLSVKDNIILYESYHGKNITGNAYAIYKGLINNKKYRNYKHVWAIDSYENPCIKELSDKNIEFVEIHTLKYAKYLATAKYLINNTSFPYYFQKREHQIYVNTWHGTPFKKMGMDIKNGGLSSHANILRNFIHADYFVNPNKFTSDILLKSHDIEGIYNGYILETGYPRIDLTLNTNEKQMKSRLNLDDDKKTILYAPTWRGVSEANQRLETEKIYEEIKLLREKFSNEYNIVLKVHYFVFNYLKEKKLEHICVPNWIDTNELLACVDILITDYSSIFFDFLPTKKPVIFYAYDQKEYENERGFYINFEDLPGPVCHHINELSNTIENISEVTKVFQHKYETFLKKYNYLDDGHATERLIETVFGGKDSSLKYKTTNRKKKLLLYCGGFYDNGITISAINLSKYIDHEKYDLTVIDFGKKNESQIANMRKLHPNIRVIYHIGTWNMSLKDYYKHNLANRKGLYSKVIQKLAPKDMYKSEIKRLLGNLEYDYVIDFGGYNKLWSTLFAFSDIKKKSIYLHNDMMQEYHKKINGKDKHKNNLKVIFSLYKYFDKVISVSQSSNETNKQNLSRYIPNYKNKMVYVNNLIDYKRVLFLKDNYEIKDLENKSYYITEKVNRSGYYKVEGVLWPEDDEVVFINMARLSPEKDQTKLIRAFSEVKKESEKNIKLYIIGSGPLLNELNDLVTQLKLENDVIFTGQIENPFGLINRGDCFIMSSHYEGQGLVILESLVLGKHVIGTDVTGIKSVLTNGLGNLVDNDQTSLEQAMYDFLYKNVQYKKFDYVKYNQEAMELFYREVCG
ncbi:CDP-glycerol glycerophosphotransferase family protein [Virgibacillus sp. W0181]|uniref:CDP-glycerol glycerophosphotransferase family protein n=1 Tax=Virgibacillus sp. W0181 TaxID=3391581 RepID=UPI003F485E80